MLYVSHRIRQKLDLKYVYKYFDTISFKKASI